MKINKKAIVIILIILMLIMLILFLLLGRKKESNNDTPIYSDYTFSSTAELEDDMGNYFTVESIIKEFNLYVSDLSVTASDLDIDDDEDENEAIQEYIDDAHEYINDVLANSYKSKYSVNNDYIDNMLKKFAKKEYAITDMYVLHDVDSETTFYNWIDTYFVYGNYEGNEFNYVIVLDKSQYTYELYLDNFFKEKGYSKDNVSTMKSLNIEKVEENDNNNYVYKSVDDKQNMVEIYFSDFVNLMKKNPTAAYDKLDSEYKQKRYDNLEKFQSYINNVVIANEFYSLQKYTVTNLVDHTEIVCQDNFGRNIIFNVEGTMRYTVLLDSYTIPVQTYDMEYENASTTKKAQLCLNRFFESINNYDYETAYSYLNNTYKENNFKTLDEFIQYITANWFKVNSFEYVEMKKEDNNYLLSGLIADTEIEGSFDAEYIDKTFVVRLGSGIRDFELSFEK